MASSQVAAGPRRPFMIFWRILLFVALLQAGLRHSDARAVNVSNTWTMPQEGLNVFYRFFRDRISWFEADAVCQFHHANLVTVDNSFQFDATRDLLRELDVNDIVWIGLMRPLSSEHFMWSNSRPLIADTGYWAEALPLMESPLCAVIDPIRDYRWHALRCGGPETASFLCEMPVPSWADACILRDMPNLTMQYMADTASVELIRNCEEDGQLRQTCKGKQDRERVIRELICPRERLEAQRINDITNSHFKSLQIINSIRTDNNENNEIELMPMEPHFPSRADAAAAASFYSRDDVIAPTEKNTVQRLIEQFSVDELMQADEPGQVIYGIPGEIPKPVKKGAGKKVLQPSRSSTPSSFDYPKKVNKPVNGKQEYPDYRMEDSHPKPIEQQQHRFSLDEMMMGDQPQGEPEMLDLGAGEKPVNAGPDDDEVSNEIMAPLPHKKKVLPQDLKTMATITEAPATEEPKKEITEEQKKLQAEKDEEAKMKEAKEDKQKKEMEAKATEAVTPKVPESPEKKSNSKEDSKESSAESKESKEEADKPTETEPTPPQSTVTSTVASMTSDTPNTSAPATTSPSSAPSVSPELLNTEQLLTTDSTTVPATIGHPMHPQQPRSNVITEETQHPHIKESADNSHFIPPMLLVKSHYVPPGKPHDGPHHDLPHHIESGELSPHHTGHSEADPKTTTHDKLLDASAPKEQVIDKPETTILKPVMKQNSSETGEKVEASATTEKAEEHGIASTAATATPKEEVATTLAAETSTPGATTPKEPTKAETPAEASTSSSLSTTEKPVATTKVAKEEDSPTAAPPLADSKTVITLSSSSTEKSVGEDATTEIRKIETVSTDKTGHEHDKLPSTSGATTTTTTTIPPPTETTTKKQDNEEQKGGSSNADDKVSSTPAPTTTTTKPAAAPTTTIAMNAPTTVITGGSTSRPAAATTPTTATPAKLPSTPKIDDDSLISTESGDGSADGSDDSGVMSTTHNFLKDEPEMPFKPNRHRSLTKPESVSYFKKILG